MESTTDVVNEKLIELNKLIIQEQRKNRELKEKLGIVEHENNASNELVSDYKQMYNSEYLKNWGLFFSILIAMSVISKTYKNNVNTI